MLHNLKLTAGFLGYYRPVCLPSVVFPPSWEGEQVFKEQRAAYSTLILPVANAEVSNSAS